MRLKFLMQQSIDEADNSGGYNRTWVDMGYFWGEIKSRNGGYGSYEGNKIQYKNFVVEMQDIQNSEISEGWRLECNGNFYEVTSVFQTKRNIAGVSLRSVDR